MLKRMNPAKTAALAVLALCTSSALPALAQGSAETETQAVQQHEVTAPRSVSRPYYIEFRSRSAQSYGHTFSIYGRLNGQGQIASKVVAGLHPATESPVPWMIGHLVLVPSETGASDGDTEDQYVTARFRMGLSADEYKRVVAYIKKLQASSPVWHAVLYNCNAFVGDIAKYMGLETPSSTMLMPADYINELRDLNIRRRDMAGVVGVPVNVPDALALRTEALKAIEQREKRKASAGRSAAPGHNPSAGRPATQSTPVPRHEDRVSTLH